MDETVGCPAEDENPADPQGDDSPERGDGRGAEEAGGQHRQPAAAAGQGGGQERGADQQHHQHRDGEHAHRHTEVGGWNYFMKYFSKLS